VCSACGVGYRLAPDAPPLHCGRSAHERNPQKRKKSTNLRKDGGPEQELATLGEAACRFHELRRMIRDHHHAIPVAAMIAR
jgi:hypothetical protein